MHLISALPLCWLPLALAYTLPVSNEERAVAAGPPAPPAAPPPSPGFTHLYTAFADVLNPIYSGEGPLGIRTALPCVGGNFSGPYFKGKVLDGGADWGLYDPQTGVFKAETRYNLLADDGATFYVQTAGPQVGGPYGNVHVAVKLETGSRKYYWVNNALIVGIVQLFDFTKVGFTLRLDTYHMLADEKNGTFVNGTKY